MSNEEVAFSTVNSADKGLCEFKAIYKAPGNRCRRKARTNGICQQHAQQLAADPAMNFIHHVGPKTSGRSPQPTPAVSVTSVGHHNYANLGKRKGNGPQEDDEEDLFSESDSEDEEEEEEEGKIEEMEDEEEDEEEEDLHGSDEADSVSENEIEEEEEEKEFEYENIPPKFKKRIKKMKKSAEKPRFLNSKKQKKTKNVKRNKRFYNELGSTFGLKPENICVLGAVHAIEALEGNNFRGFAKRLRDDDQWVGVATSYCRAHRNWAAKYISPETLLLILTAKHATFAYEQNNPNSSGMISSLLNISKKFQSQPQPEPQPQPQPQPQSQPQPQPQPQQKPVHFGTFADTTCE